MVISSLIVETAPHKTKQVTKNLIEMPMVEVYGICEHQIVILIEEETVESSHCVASSLPHLDGVQGVNLVYANFEDDPVIQKARAK